MISAICLFVALLLILSSAAQSSSIADLVGEKPFSAQRSSSSISDFENVVWKDAYELATGGLYFDKSSLQSPFDRLPLDAKASVPEGVWNQSIKSAGIHVEFVTNSVEIYINYNLSLSATQAWNMDAGGYSSVDLYAFDVVTNMYRWITTWELVNYPNNTGLLASGIGFKAEKGTLYRLNFPLSNRVSTLSIGVSTVTSTTNGTGPLIFKKPALLVSKVPAIVWYGTSIAQGASSSIPSASYITQLNLANYPRFNILNFGFSSNGKMDLSVMNYLNQITPVEAFIIDCLPNMNYEEVGNNTIPLVQSIRDTHSTDVPIVLVESAIYGEEWWSANFKYNQEKKRSYLKAAYDALIASGITNLYYVEGEQIISPQEVSISYQVDGTHPTDLGMYKMFTFWNSYLNNKPWGRRV